MRPSCEKTNQTAIGPLDSKLTNMGATLDVGIGKFDNTGSDQDVRRARFEQVMATDASPFDFFSDKISEFQYPKSIFSRANRVPMKGICPKL